MNKKTDEKSNCLDKKRNSDPHRQTDRQTTNTQTNLPTNIMYSMYQSCYLTVYCRFTLLFIVWIENNDFLL